MNRKRYMNKKGDVPTVLLFVVALVLTVAALFSFVSFNDEFSEGSDEMSNILSDVLFYEKYIVRQSESIGRQVLVDLGVILPEDFVGPVSFPGEEELKKKFQEIADERNLGIDGLENYYGKVKRGEFSFSLDESGNYVFEMREVFVYSSHGENKIKRTFSFRIEFDSRGEVVKRKF